MNSQKLRMLSLKGTVKAMYASMAALMAVPKDSCISGFSWRRNSTARKATRRRINTRLKLRASLLKGLRPKRNSSDHSSCQQLSRLVRQLCRNSIFSSSLILAYFHSSMNLSLSVLRVFSVLLFAYYSRVTASMFDCLTALAIVLRITVSCRLSGVSQSSCTSKSWRCSIACSLFVALYALISSFANTESLSAR